MRNRKNENPQCAAQPYPFPPSPFPPRPSRSLRGPAEPPPHVAHPALGRPAGTWPSSVRPSCSPRPSTDSPHQPRGARVGSCPAAVVAWWGPPVSPHPKTAPVHLPYHPNARSSLFPARFASLSLPQVALAARSRPCPDVVCPCRLVLHGEPPHLFLSRPPSSPCSRLVRPWSLGADAVLPRGVPPAP
jgi:hypothetical protein